MKNEFTLENTKDATHYAISKVGKINFYKLCGGISFMMGSTTNFEWEEFGPALKLTSLTDETGRGYPTLEWFLDAEHLLEEGDVVITESGKSITVSEENDHNGINGWNTGVTDDNKRWVKSTHDNRHDLTQMARDEYYSKIGKPVKLSEHPLKKEVIDKINSGEITFSAPTGEKQWPKNDRIDAIGQNGNNGEHYPHESESPLSPNFESKPFYTQEMREGGEPVKLSDHPLNKEVFGKINSGEITFSAPLSSVLDNPVFTQAMADAGQLPVIGAKYLDGDNQLCITIGHTSMSDIVGEMVELVSGHEYAAISISKANEIKPIDTRTDEEKLRDAITDAVNPYIGKMSGLQDELLASNKFTITLNKEG